MLKNGVNLKFNTLEVWKKYASTYFNLPALNV